MMFVGCMCTSSCARSGNVYTHKSFMSSRIFSFSLWQSSPLTLAWRTCSLSALTAMGTSLTKSPPLQGLPDQLPPASLPQKRLEDLLDAGSLQLIGTRIQSRRLGDEAYDGDGVLTGFGTVEGSPVACYAQDPRVSAGALGEAQAQAIVRILSLARDAGMPVVSFLESSGARIQEGVAGLVGYARVFHEIVSLSRQIPQISIVTGSCAGGGAYSPALTDFVIMTEEAAMFLTGPRIVREACGETVTGTELGGSRVHRGNGVCQIVAADDVQAAAKARELLSFLPRNSSERPRVLSCEPQLTTDPGTIMPRRASAVYDVRDVVGAIADSGHFLEIDARWARNMVTGFIRIGGRSAGVIANQPRFIGGVIDTHASEKGARFVDMCNAYDLPLVVLVDTPGFMPGTRQEREGIIRLGAGLVRAFASARVPSFTVILRKAYGGAYIAMNSLHLGATLTFAWPDAEVGVMDARSAVGLVHRASLAGAGNRDELLGLLAAQYHGEHCNVANVAREGFVDEVIEPVQTRERLRLALATFAHGSEVAA
jgi:acetyl-CoA carboxylase carboxyltransferase component